MSWIDYTRGDKMIAYNVPYFSAWWWILLKVKLISWWESESKPHLSPIAWLYWPKTPNTTAKKIYIFFFLCSMVCLLGSSGYISHNQSFAITDVWEVGVTSTISNVPETRSCTVLSPRLKCYSFIKLVLFKIASSGLTLLCDLLILSSCLKIEFEGAEIKK